MKDISSNFKSGSGWFDSRFVPCCVAHQGLHFVIIVGLVLESLYDCC